MPRLNDDDERSKVERDLTPSDMSTFSQVTQSHEDGNMTVDTQTRDAPVVPSSNNPRGKKRPAANEDPDTPCVSSSDDDVAPTPVPWYANMKYGKPVYVFEPQGAVDNREGYPALSFTLSRETSPEVPSRSPTPPYEVTLYHTDPYGNVAQYPRQPDIDSFKHLEYEQRVNKARELIEGFQKARGLDCSMMMQVRKILHQRDPHSSPVNVGKDNQALLRKLLCGLQAPGGISVEHVAMLVDIDNKRMEWEKFIQVQEAAMANSCKWSVVRSWSDQEQV